MPYHPVEACTSGQCPVRSLTGVMGVDSSILTLAFTASTVALLHALLGPDHYVPFIALGRARGWSLGRTLGITAACGSVHVLGSVVLGVLLVSLGRSASAWARWEAFTGEVVGWLLLGFGAAYAVWGVRHALSRHARLPSSEGSGGSLAPWGLFLLFAFGPCEPLIPLAVVPAARQSWVALLWVVGAFGVVTLVAMMGTVAVGYLGARRIKAESGKERWSHALAGMALVACGAAVRMGL